jgi:hypothetical protein
LRRQHNETETNTMIKNLTVKSRLAVVIGLLSLLLVAIGFAGLSGMASTNEGLRTVYEDRTIPVGRLGEIEHVGQNIARLERLAGEMQAAMARFKLQAASA